MADEILVYSKYAIDGRSRVSRMLLLRPALPSAVVAGYWDSCPHCSGPVYLPIAGGKESKAPVQCPGCMAVLRPDC